MESSSRSGPVTHDGPVRLVSADALADVLRRASTLPALQAVRDLAEQLEHLDQTGVAGLTVKGLGTEHLFRERLRQTADWPALAELAAPVTGSWRDALRGAGYELEELPRGYLARHDGAPVAVVHPVADVSAFAKLDAEGRPPEGILLEALPPHERALRDPRRGDAVAAVRGGAGVGLGDRPLPRARHRRARRRGSAAARPADAALSRRRAASAG